MKSEALKKLRGHSIVNAFDKHYPDTRHIAINTTELHIKIYELVDEYVSLYDDLEKVSTPTARGYITERMRAIERELTDFWIVPDDKMITPQK